MTPERWQEIRPILESALELDLARRSAFLDTACSNSELRLAVESLLALNDRTSASVLDAAAPLRVHIEDSASTRLPVGQRIGPYEILEEIGVGGMGAVYRANRADGEYRQQVALKIVRTDVSSELITAQFKNERQILASLNHPNIARILDGGTADGISYLVMELIDGLPITDYCDRHRLTITARLTLFRTVCAAVHYAHQHLVIHRDIKPANILVTADGTLRLLDFGIARMLNAEASPLKIARTPESRLMTPEYASPEQLRGETVTTASDVYSLGLVLYELLSGHRAFRLSGEPPHEFARIVSETNPEKPSTAILRTDPVERREDQDTLNAESISRLRSVTTRQLQRRLTGDLDCIVMRGIRSAPEARYGSADHLAEDLRRHMEGFPIQARKSTLSYQLGKYVSRHKVAVTAATFVLLTLIIGLIITARETRIARANELRAEQRSNDIRRLANSLVLDMNDSIQQLNGATITRKLIVERAQEYLANLVQEAKTDPALLRELATAYTRLAAVQGNPSGANIGDTKAALENNRKATALLESAAALQPSNQDIGRELALSYTSLAVELAQIGDVANSRALHQKSQRILEQLATATPEDPEIQFALGKAYAGAAALYSKGGDLSEALELHRKASVIYERLYRSDVDNQKLLHEISFSHKHIGSVLAVQKQFPTALDHYQAALTIDEAQLARNPQNVDARYNITYAYNDTGYILGAMGDVNAALGYYRKSLEIRRALAAIDPQNDRTRQGVSYTLSAIGDNLAKKADYADALESYKQSLAIREALAEKDVANEGHRFSISEMQSCIGGVYAAMALRNDIPSVDRLKYCSESRQWNRNSLPTWMARQAQGKLGPGGAENLAQTMRNIEKCNRLIAQLERGAQPLTK